MHFQKKDPTKAENIQSGVSHQESSDSPDPKLKLYLKSVLNTDLQLSQENPYLKTNGLSESFDYFGSPILHAYQDQTKQDKVQTSVKSTLKASSFEKYSQSKDFKLSKSQVPKNRNQNNSGTTKSFMNNAYAHAKNADFNARGTQMGLSSGSGGRGGGSGQYFNSGQKGSGQIQSLTNYTSQYNKAIKSAQKAESQQNIQSFQAEQSPYQQLNSKQMKLQINNQSSIKQFGNQNSEEQRKSFSKENPTQFQTLTSSVFYNKDQLYRVKGSSFVKNNQVASIQYEHQLNSLTHDQNQNFAPTSIQIQNKFDKLESNYKLTNVNQFEKDLIQQQFEQQQFNELNNNEPESFIVNQTTDQTNKSYFNYSKESNVKPFQVNDSQNQGIRIASIGNKSRNISNNIRSQKTNQTTSKSNYSVTVKSQLNNINKIAPQNSNSLLLNLLNLKQLQANESAHESQSPEKQTSSFMASKIEQSKLDGIAKFFQKRKVTPDFQANQVNRKIVATLRQSRNNISNNPQNLVQIQSQQPFQTSQSFYVNQSDSFYKSQNRKYFLEQQQKGLLQKLGLKNSFYEPGNNSKSFLDHHMSQMSTHQAQHEFSVESQINQSQMSVSQNTKKTGSRITNQFNSPVKAKRLNPYEKREKEFQKVYQNKLEEMRRSDQMFSKFPTYKHSNMPIPQPDISIFKERNDPYKVLSNRIKTRALMQEHKYFDKNVKILEKFFDPLHIRLRVMPVSRAPLVQGKNSDYYFLEGSKLSLKGELTKAIEQLKKGLELKHSHFLCRFNHGVLLFKLGLLQEATEDFEHLMKLYGQKEQAIAYNLAIFHCQNGQYEESLKLCTQVIDFLLSAQSKQHSIDKELLQDAYKLKGICAFRLGNAFESIRCYNFSNKYKKDVNEERKLNEGRLREITGRELESVYIGLFIEETKMIFQDSKFQRSLLRMSKSMTNLRPLVFEMQNFKRFGSVKDLNVKSQKDHFATNKKKEEIDIVISEGTKEFEIDITNIELENQHIEITDQAKDLLMFSEQRPTSFSMKKSERMDFHKLLTNPKGTTKNNNFAVEDVLKRQLSTKSKQQPNEFLGVEPTPSTKNKNQISLSKQKSAVTPQGFGTYLSSMKKDPSVLGGRSSSKSPKSPTRKNPVVSQIEINLLKNLIGMKSLSSKQEDEKELVEKRQKFLEDQFYREMSQFKESIVNAGSSIRYDRVYQPDDDVGNTLRKEDLTKEERDQIERRKRIEEELNSSKDNTQLKLLQQKEQQDKFLQFLLNANEIKMRQLIGTEDNNSMTSVLYEQQRLEDLLVQIREKFEVKELEWEREFAVEQARINHPTLQDEQSSDDEEEYEALTNMRSPVNNDNEEDRKSQTKARKKRARETIIDKLNKSLIDNDVTPDDIQNMLIKDRDDKKLKESLRKNRTRKQRKRLALRQVEIIRKEFQSLNQEDVNQKKTLRTLDSIMSTLKFFQRFDLETRLKIYQNAEYISLDAQTTIFNQGDVGDKLYVIVKGRVAVQVNSPEYGNLPVVVATLNDGEQFGELSLIKLDKLQDNSKTGEISSVHQAPKLEFAFRKASCITVEQTDLLALPKEVSIQLYQPDAAPKRRISRISISRSLFEQKNVKNYESKDSNEDKDELNKKINFLQSISLFEDIDAKLLMPIAVNMIPCTFNFGEFIIKEGEMPKGLYLIKSGQCKVACRRIAERDQNQVEQQQLNKKLGEKKKIKDKHPLFNEFDPENSILNEVKSLNKVFQNDRLFVSATGEQVRGKIVYQDIMTFSQLMPKNHFGGRCLIPFEMYLNLRRIYFGQEELDRYYPKNTPQTIIDTESEEEYQLKSILSVIADAGQVEVYILDKNVMSYIPDFILRRVFEKIANTREPDRPYSLQKIEEIKEAMVKWDKYKVKCVEKLFKEKQLLERNNQAR